VRVYETGSCTILMLTPHPGLIPLKGRRNLTGQHGFPVFLSQLNRIRATFFYPR
jgi:hypothetical protein